MRFPLFLFLFPNEIPQIDKEVSGRACCIRTGFYTTDTAHTGLEVPTMYFGFHYLTTRASSPVRCFVELRRGIYMLVTIRRAQFKITVDTMLIFPFHSISIGDMGNQFGFSLAVGAYVPMTRCVTHEVVVVCMSGFAFITTEIAIIIAFRGVYVLILVDFLFTPYANFPVGFTIVKQFIAGFVSRCQGETAEITGFSTTAGKRMLFMPNVSIALCAACPVIQVILIPVVA